MRDFLIEHEQGNAYRRFYRRQFFRLLRFKFGWINDRVFKERWILDTLSLFNGYSAEQFAEMSDWVAERVLWAERRQAVVAELRQHRADGRRVIVISGLFEPMLDAFVRRLGDGFEKMGTPLQFENGVFTGKTAWNQPFSQKFMMKKT